MSDIPENENTDQAEDGALVPKNGTADSFSIADMYRDYFLDYASYVILERAVPDLADGLKPVQRRILHAMKKLDDGRFMKVANLIGSTMQYHPHGDASIGEALVGLGQKNLLIETQGNWGNIFTGDEAAAPRYIEARLSKFAHAVAFNPKTTVWKSSYDGRNAEPVTLPMKFPLLLAQGVEGIAVGLASKILPHNFNELIDAAIAHLQNRPFVLYPDFPTAGLADVSKYNGGLQGGKVRVRARIRKIDKRTLEITEIPFGKTTSTLIDSIIAASEKGKVRIRKIDDNTAEKVSILLFLHGDVSADQTIDALYALTDCEISISPNNCVIDKGRPAFMTAEEMLRHSTDHTRNLLRLELEIRLNELLEDWHFSSLERIFIENRIYLAIEDCETWEAIIETIDRELTPFKKMFMREITVDDITRLTEIKIKRISKFDSAKADERIRAIESEMNQVRHNLAQLTEYAIAFYENIRERFGAGRERKTELRPFDVIEAARVAAATSRLYVNRAEGFIGTGLKKDEFVCECSDIDDIIAFRRDGKYQISKVNDKVFMGKDLIHVAVFDRGDDRTVYNAVYRDGRNGASFIKRFTVGGITRDKEYDVTQGSDNSELLYFTANPNGEAEVVTVQLRPRPRLRKINFDIDFADLAIKGRSSRGNLVSKTPVYKVKLKEKGVSTLSGREIWFDRDVLRLNTDGHGLALGSFSGEDKIVYFTASGSMRVCETDIAQHFEDDTILVERFDPEAVYSALVLDAEQGFYYLKRFCAPDSDRPLSFLPEAPGSKLIALSALASQVEITFGGRHQDREAEILSVKDFIGVKGYKAHGKRISTLEIAAVRFLEPEAADSDQVDAPTDQDDNMESDENGIESPPPENSASEENEDAAQEMIRQRSLFD